MQVVCLFVHVIVKIQTEGECFSWQCWLFVCWCMSLWRSKLKEKPLLRVMNDGLFVCACSVDPLLGAWMTGCLFVCLFVQCDCAGANTCIQKSTREYWQYLEGCRISVDSIWCIPPGDDLLEFCSLQLSLLQREEKTLQSSTWNIGGVFFPRKKLSSQWKKDILTVVKLFFWLILW